MKQKIVSCTLLEDLIVFFSDIYQHDQSPVEEIPDNTLFSERSGFPSDPAEAQVTNNAAGFLRKNQDLSLVFIGFFVMVMQSRTS